MPALHAALLDHAMGLHDALKQYVALNDTCATPSVELRPEGGLARAVQIIADLEARSIPAAPGGYRQLPKLPRKILVRG